MKFDNREGWMWPAEDIGLWKVARDYTVLSQAIPHCRQKRAAIQAGGACGTFPNWLSQYFRVVYTFEPDAENFACLSFNCRQPNVVKMQAALAEATGMVALECRPNNCGAAHIAPGGFIPALALDNLAFPPVDLIQLDTEGSETSVLQGAFRLIQRDRPVIVIEHKGLHGRFGSEDPDDMLRGFGYRQVSSYQKDRIYIHEV